MKILPFSADSRAETGTVSHLEISLASFKDIKPRRDFIVTMSSTVGSFWLTACGGGSDATAAIAAVEPASAELGGAEIQAVPEEATKTIAATPSEAAAAPGQLVAFTLQCPSVRSSTAAPFCIGHAFRKGDVPASSNLVSNIDSIQVTPKNRWPDGSLKFAVVAGRAAIGAGQAVSIPLKLGAPAARNALTTANLRATGATAVISASGIGAASWSGSDWDAPFQSWIAGPEMSSWVYRKPVGSDAHLVAWLEVRVFAGGEVEILPWVENGYLRVEGPTLKSATYAFSLGGSQRFAQVIDLPHHCRTPLVNKTALSYWLKNDPGVIPRHDTAYLQASELVPSYRANVPSTVASTLALTYIPLQAGDFRYYADNMASPGYQSPIGLLPTHDVMYLVCDNPVATYGAVVRNGYSAGRYPIHYRDETTQRPLRFSSYPSLVISDGSGYKDNGGSSTNSYTPKVNGTGTKSWDIAHHPSVGYMAYLVTGRWYFMEEVQFAATTNFLGQNNIYIRNFSAGWLLPVEGGLQTRGCAWGLRTLVQALTVTPDTDTVLRTEFSTSFESNIQRLHSLYVAQKNNPFGVVLPGESYGGGAAVISPWQQDFITAAIGYALSLDLPITTDVGAKLSKFFAWKAQTAVGRLGTSSAFWYVNAVPYTLTIAPGSTPNYANGNGPWHNDWAAVYAATYATPVSWKGSAEGMLAAEIMPGANAMWGNLQPAIAYAVRHGVDGALEAYNRMLSANNWGALASQLNSYPVWGVQPSTVAQSLAVRPVESPQNWLAGKPLNTWIEIADTSGAGGAAVNAWGTLVHIPGTGLLISPANGGHSDSFDNRVTSIDLLQDRPTWTVQIAASSTVDVRENVEYYADGRPVSRHGYHHSHYVAQRRRVMLFGAYGWYSNGGAGFAVDGFSVSGKWAWDPAGTYDRLVAGRGFGSAHDPVTGNVWTSVGWCWTQATNTWSQRTRFPLAWRWPVAYEPTRRIFFTLQFGDGQGFDLHRGIVSAIFSPETGGQTPIAFNPSTAVTQFKSSAPTYAGMDYDPINDRFLFYDGQGAASGRVYVITPNATTTWDMSILSLGGKAPGPSPLAGTNGRFRYVPALRGFVVMPQASSNLFFFRTG